MINTIEEYINKLEEIYNELENIPKPNIKNITKDDINNTIRFCFDNILGGNEKDIISSYILYKNFFDLKKENIKNICEGLQVGSHGNNELQLNELIEEMKEYAIGKYIM